jgi:hypothetical protein
VQIGLGKLLQYIDGNGGVLGERGGGGNAGFEPETLQHVLHVALNSG